MSFYANPGAPERKVTPELDAFPRAFRQSLLQTLHLLLTRVLCVTIFDTVYLIVPWWQTHKLNQVLACFDYLKPIWANRGCTTHLGRSWEGGEQPWM